MSIRSPWIYDLISVTMDFLFILSKLIFKIIVDFYYIQHKA
ncbi:hypothetical protein [Clostridium yunnanense]|nr:hypothetical protein [Clostridium yunnanense]